MKRNEIYNSIKHTRDYLRQLSPKHLDDVETEVLKNAITTLKSLMQIMRMSIQLNSHGIQDVLEPLRHMVENNRNPYLWPAVHSLEAVKKALIEKESVKQELKEFVEEWPKDEAKALVSSVFKESKEGNQ